MKIIFFGTPEFAVGTLRAILNAGYAISAVVTAPDKPKGRGQQVAESDVKIFAKEKGLKILQPEKLKAPEFIESLKKLNADLFVVVAFRMMPEAIWKMPSKGTINLHASLLPQYRGASPINWAIINGETKTGVTTFFISHNIDTGNLIYQESVEISSSDNAGTLHDKLMIIGAILIVKTISDIEKGTNPSLPQNINYYVGETGLKENLKHAPKLFKHDCLINWNKTSLEIYNHIKGLSPYPTAYFELIDEKGVKFQMKIFEAVRDEFKIRSGEIVSDGKTFLSIGTKDGSLFLKEVQMPNKKRMKINEFLRGFRCIGLHKVTT